MEARLFDGSTIVARRHGNVHGPRVVLTCGGGFAADLYWPYWSLLLEDFDVVVYDLRSHGWNQPSDIRLHNIPTLADDNRRVLKSINAAFGVKPTAGVYHSLSAVVALMHEDISPAFAALVLFDPPIYPPGADLHDMEAVCQRLATAARRRRRRFESPDQLAARLKRTPEFSLVPEATLELLARSTLRPSPDGGYELRCPPEYEAQLFEWFFGHSMQVPDILNELTIPVKVIGADPTATFSFLPSMDLRMLSAIDYDFLPDHTHFVQLEAPRRCAAITTEFLRQHTAGILPVRA